MDDLLTMEEIKARYAPDCVLIAEPQTDAMQRLLRDRVDFRSSDRDECWHKARELKLERAAVRDLEEWPEGRVFAL